MKFSKERRKLFRIHHPFTIFSPELLPVVVPLLLVIVEPATIVGAAVVVIRAGIAGGVALQSGPRVGVEVVVRKPGSKSQPSGIKEV